MIRREREGDNGEKGRTLYRTIIKDIWTTTRRAGNGGGRWGGLGEEGRKLLEQQ